MTVDLSGIRAKLERAYEHRNALESEIAPVLAGKRHQIEMVNKFDPDSGYNIFRVSRMPDEWRLRVAVVLGELVHSLRSALDQLAWQLVLSHSGRPKTPKNKIQIEFPIKYRRKALRSTHTFGKISRSDRTILDKAQPYSGMGNPKLHGLAVIQQLSNRDKHRVLSPILLTSSKISVRRTNSPEVYFQVSHIKWKALGKNLKVGTEVVWLKLVQPPDAEVEVTGYLTPKIRLPQGPDIFFIGGLDVMILTVEKIVARFAAKYGV